MSKHKKRQLKLVSLVIVVIQMIALTGVGTLTALQPTPQMAQTTAQTLGLGGRVRRQVSGWLAQQSQSLFGAPATDLAQAVPAILSYMGPDSFDVSKAIYAGGAEAFYHGAVEGGLPGMRFNYDGSKMFIIGEGHRAVVEYNLATPFDVSTAVYAGAAEELNVAARDPSPDDLAFNNDGMKLFILGRANGYVYEYNLAAPYDVSTGVYAGNAERLLLNISNARSMAFNPQGTKLFVAKQGLSPGAALYKFNLTVPFDVSTGVYAGNAEALLTGFNIDDNGVIFTPDGSRFFTANVNSIRRWNLATPYDISTATLAPRYLLGVGASLTGITTLPRYLTFNNDGSKFYTGNESHDSVREFYIDKGDYTEAGVLNGSINNIRPMVISLMGDTFQDTDGDNLLDVGSEVFMSNVPPGLTPVMTLTDSDTKVTLTFTGNALAHHHGDNVADLTFVFANSAFVSGNANNVRNSGTAGAYSSGVGIEFYEAPTLSYVGPNSFDVSKAVYAGAAKEINVSAEDTAPRGLFFNPDGTKMFVAGSTGRNILEYSLSVPYDVSTAVYAGNAESFYLGNQDSTLSVQDIMFINDGSIMFALDSTTDLVSAYSLGVPYDVSTAVYLGGSRSLYVGGVETTATGIALSNDGTKLFVVGSVSDQVHTYVLAIPYDLSSAVYAGAPEALSVAGEETSSSGLAFSKDGRKLFLIGTTSDAVVEYNLGTPFMLSTATYAGASERLLVSAQETDPRGLAFNNDGSKVFIINSIIREYDIQKGDYLEAAANDGSLDNSKPLSIVLVDETFQDTDNDNLLDVGTEVTITNVPPGLTPVMTLSDGDSKVTLTFTGNATSHQDVNDVAELTFVFDDTAFTRGNASDIQNAGTSGAYGSGVGIDFASTPPTITSDGGGATASVNVAENTSAVTTVTVAITGTTPITYSLNGGADALKFTINSSSGALSFVTAPDFENPTDSGANNIYDVIARATNSAGFDDQAIAVTVTDVADTPDLTTVIGQPSPNFVVGVASNVPLTVTNSGTTTTTGTITATMTLPAGTSAPASFTDGAWSCTTSGQTVTCTQPGPLAVGDSSTLQVPVTPDVSTVGMQPVFNATSSGGGETNTGNNPASPMTPTTPVAGVPDLTTSIGQPSPNFVVGVDQQRADDGNQQRHHNDDGHDHGDDDTAGRRECPSQLHGRTVDVRDQRSNCQLHAARPARSGR